jgi:hypothetical protein
MSGAGRLTTWSGQKGSLHESGTTPILLGVAYTCGVTAYPAKEIRAVSVPEDDDNHNGKIPRIQLAWGRRGAQAAAERGDILVVIDTLRFSTAAATAVHHSALISPCSPDQQDLTAFEQLAQQYVEADAERQRLGLDPNAFAIYTTLKPYAGAQLTTNSFLGVVPIDIKRFAESGVSFVECPDCGRTWTLSPRGGVVRFKSHDKRKMATSHTAEWWAIRETIWKVVGGENK